MKPGEWRRVEAVELKHNDNILYLNDTFTVNEIDGATVSVIEHKTYDTLEFESEYLEFCTAPLKEK